MKRGEHLDWAAEKVIENELAARILLAFDRKDPSSCHQTYKLFDELHADLFGRPEVDAYRVVALHDIFAIVMDKLSLMSNSLFARYSLTRYLLIYLIREALETDATGKEFCANPAGFISNASDRAHFKSCAASICASLVRFLDNEFKRKTADGMFYDYKRELKSPKAVQDLAAAIISQYQIVIDNGYAPKFTDEWGRRRLNKKLGAAR